VDPFQGSERPDRLNRRRCPGWRDNLFSGAIKLGQVRRIVLETDRVVGEQKLTIGQWVRDVRQGPDGYLYTLTDEDDGLLLRILSAVDACVTPR
jgi:glucose/arabinose dehydrogenase